MEAVPATRIAKDEQLLWVYFCVTVCTIPGQYLFLESSSFELITHLGGRVSQGVVLGAMLYMVGDKGLWYSEKRFTACMVSYVVMWVLHLSLNMALLSHAVRSDMPLVGVAAVYCSVAVALAFQ
eukprot:6065225-Prymnesium_polylepis.1